MEYGRVAYLVSMTRDSRIEVILREQRLMGNLTRPQRDGRMKMLGAETLARTARNRVETKDGRGKWAPISKPHIRVILER